MTFETYLSLEMGIPTAAAERWLGLTNDLREVLAKPENLEAMREHYDRKQRNLAARQRAVAVGDALFAYLQGAAVQAGFEPQEWATEFDNLNAHREAWSAQLPTNQEEQT